MIVVYVWGKKRRVGKFTKTPRGATAAVENVVE